MKLPETQNANHLYAFKKGYRLAMDGKSLTLMPSLIKLDNAMKTHFESGWHQYQDDLAEALENEKESPWRNKAIWMVMAIVAGLATASVMIQNIQQEKQKNKPQKIAKGPVTATSAVTPLSQQTQAPNSDDFGLLTAAKSQTKKPSTPLEEKQKLSQKPANEKPGNSLSLLSHDERTDLELSKQEATSAPALTETPLVQSPIQIRRAVFTTEITNREPGKVYNDVIPKFVRKLYFFTQIEKASGEMLYHRWRYNGKVMATIPLQIKGQNFRTWSSKRLSSAWSGHWDVEILNSQKQPIYRKTFIYSQ
ncbi:DUF2914 domain-containing protein [Hydrogenovibrio sp. JE_KL2]|uniref:DUF2914 domain-containing protein n=1 Tax=Hydrogenovibrio sp. JE_KL2 TaxID=2651188 RepID=UPI00128B0287|nr:DUF2914 domain-containing protein [Hydrogenovibrio sp. JE_KL2]MPQ76616.1 DUF2914 domain-containing protein [Hydrogenovibrio sp. JE_KL2]